MTRLHAPPLAPTLVLPEIARAALLLDLDGTLLDIAATPEAVVVPDGLIDALSAWRDRLGGALALVTGRPIASIDHLLPDVPTAVAGEHGAALRRTRDGAIERSVLPILPPSWLSHAAGLVARHPGTRLETKAHGFVVHYRAMPAFGPAIGADLAALMAGQKVFALIPAHMAWEVRPGSIDKGRAVAAVMDAPPFAGRLPVFIGDDVTDQDGIQEARRCGGAGLFVPEHFGDAAGVRAWLS
jgi:trehalose 6-phosphate phosphatase